MTTAVKVDRAKLAELDSLADLEREISEAERAERERRERAQERTIAQAIELIRSTPRRPKVRNSDPATAHAAAMEATDLRPKIEARLVWAYHELGEMTADEAAQAIGHDPYSASTHVSTLKGWGWLEATGETRETRRGGTAQVLRLVLTVASDRQLELEVA